MEGAETIVISLTDIPAQRSENGPSARSPSVIRPRTYADADGTADAYSHSYSDSHSYTYSCAGACKPSFAFLSPDGTGDEGTFAYVVIVRSDNVTVPCDVTFKVAGGTR